MNHLILHLDADAFFASLEQRDDPKLRGKPVAVGTGVVASCSYEARRYGVETGMRLMEARSLCRDLIVVPGAYPRYEQAARRVLAVCLEQTPTVEVMALDDLYLDLTRHPRQEAVAGTIQEQIRDEVQLSVSIGAAANKLVARVATREAKQKRLRMAGEKGTGPFSSGVLSPFRPPSAIGNLKSAMVQVSPGTERTYLAPWPARVLPGVGPKVAGRLERLNVARVGEVAAMPLPVLTGLFRTRGRVLRDQSWGIDSRPVLPHRPQQSISRRSSFDPPVADRAFLRAMLDYLLERAVSWLRFHHLAARGMEVTIRYGDYEGDTGRVSFRTPTDQGEDFREAARDRFDRLYQRRLPLRLLGVELAPLVPPEHRAELFPDPEAERCRRLAECKDAIRRRFGFTSLLSGSALLLSGRLDRDRENFQMRTPCLTR
jgi:DNA polymerase-4